MNRYVLLCGVLAACGGSRTPAVESESLGTANHATASSHPATSQQDPALAFRKQYVDPGGMWMPVQMTLPLHVENFRKMGVKLDPQTLADPKSPTLAAIVSLTGCTGSFVSPEGLIVTNHHCAQRALQFNSTDARNLVQTGYLAATRADELPAAPSDRVMVVQGYRDVTHEMRDGLDAIKDPVARKEDSERRQKELVAACEKNRPGVRCSVASFFRGGLYQLIESLEIRDVRLVYAPPRSVGNYGGEIDNWEWPRHTGDWSFFRAYVGKDGAPADFAKDNVPYRPASYLHVSAAGVHDSDFVMVTGYPGHTERAGTASEIHHDVEWGYPYEIAYDQERYKLLERHVGDPGETGIKATTAKQRVQNFLEKYTGILEGMKKGDLVQRKDELDRKIKDWAAQPGHETQKAAIDKLEAILAEQFRSARVDFDRNAVFDSSKLLANAIHFTRWAEERGKQDPDRKPGYQERDMNRAIAAQKAMSKQFDRTLDREGFRLALVRALQLPESDRPWLAQLLDVRKGAKIDEAVIDKTLDGWYKATKLEDPAVRLALLEKGTPRELAASRDPFVQAAQRIWPTYKAEEKKRDARTGDLLLVAPAYVEAMKAVLGGAVAPDANGTLRITYGTVKSLRPGSKDQADSAFTVASQIPAKNTGKEPFDAPPALLAAVQAKDYGPYADPALGGELPVDFLSDLDITNGNSGSPTLNDKGELVGLAFDGNKEGLASDVVFNPVTTRTIHVDARYMIWNMDLLDGADHLIREMGLTPKLQQVSNGQEDQNSKEAHPR